MNAQYSPHVTSDDVVLTMIQDGDHRLSRPQDIARLIAAVEEIGQPGEKP